MDLRHLWSIRRSLHSDENLSVYVTSVHNQLCDESVGPEFHERQAPSCHRSHPTTVGGVNDGSVVWQLYGAHYTFSGCTNTDYKRASSSYANVEKLSIQKQRDVR